MTQHNLANGNDECSDKICSSNELTHSDQDKGHQHGEHLSKKKNTHFRTLPESLFAKRVLIEKEKPFALFLFPKNYDVINNLGHKMTHVGKEIQKRSNDGHICVHLDEAFHEAMK